MKMKKNNVFFIRLMCKKNQTKTTKKKTVYMLNNAMGLEEPNANTQASKQYQIKQT